MGHQGITFEFKSRRKYFTIWEKLIRTAYDFTSPEYKEITVYEETAIEEIREYCKKYRILVKEK